MVKPTFSALTSKAQEALARKKGDSLQVTAQQSRFHLDALNLTAPTTSEILVKNLSISVGSKEILTNAELFLKEGGHYVLVGRNGVGKSTLLKALAEGRVPGVSWGIKILLLGQTRELSLEEKIGGVSVRDETVLEHVVRSDAARESLVKEAEVLSKAVENHVDSTATVKAYRQVAHQRLQKQLDEWRQIATRRSGARGKDARKELIIMEEEFAESLERLSADLEAIDPAVLSAETNEAVDMLSEVQSRLEMMNASAAAAKARTVLLGLGFPAEKIEEATSKLSGGWRTRCDLACALCQTADVLFLDEPTNFLDLPSIIWLEDFVKNLEGTTVVVVTHDRGFADNVGEELLVLRNQKIERFKGNLSTYESERIKKAKWLTDMKDAQEKQKSHMQQSIASAQSAAKSTGDDKKLKQAASRQKKLDERMGMQVNAKGHRFKLNRDMGGYHNASRAGIDVPDFDPPVKIKFPPIPPDLRFPGSLVSLENISFAYAAGKGRKGPEILKDVSLTIHPGERIGICGLNGSGKTTLVSLIMGTKEHISSPNAAAGLMPMRGTITSHPRATFSRFSQQVVEELEDFGNANPEVSSLKHLMDVAEGHLGEKEARATLGSLGLQGAIASDVPIAALSGGQKVRLAIAKLVFNPPHLLILDEVTTHLDADTILGLMLALRDYEGALLLVTHDRFFMRCVVEGQNPAKIWNRANVEEGADEGSEDDEEDEISKKRIVYRMFRGQLRVLQRGMEEYEELCENAAQRLSKPKALA
ncbi:hypothetical protein FKW77_002532 [Venturia effusa]|uniref:ABC transporter domain-containing protein n=1 Tax=Venturia effusa TaxID=50376 RepID=A0A517L8V2_9PEZI|nr:hypothetical protein FKW77_002532 [Venturia effusa]